jgi:hypothetical protein
LNHDACSNDCLEATLPSGMNTNKHIIVSPSVCLFV